MSKLRIDEDNCSKLNCYLCAKPIDDKNYQDHFSIHTKNLVEFEDRFVNGDTNVAEIALQNWCEEVINTADIMEKKMLEDMKKLWVNFDREEKQECLECGEHLDLETLCVHYEIHFKCLEDDIDHYYTKRKRKGSENNSSQSKFIKQDISIRLILGNDFCRGPHFHILGPTHCPWSGHGS